MFVYMKLQKPLTLYDPILIRTQTTLDMYLVVSSFCPLSHLEYDPVIKPHL